GAGTDLIAFDGWSSAVTLNLGSSAAQSVVAGSLRVSSIENVRGGKGSDSFTGSAVANEMTGGLGGNDTLNGAGGDDLLRAWSGHDTFTGGAGEDTISFADFVSNVNINLQLTGAQVHNSGSATITGVENLTTGSGDDSLR